MWYTPYETSIRKKVGKYLLRVVFVLWIIVSFVVGYFYLVATGFQEDIKGGTFVEGIFDQISYLPYLKSDDQSTFYQKFLFRSCLNLYETDENGDYAQDLCKVYTEDDQHYVLKIIDENAVWSDGTPVTIDDVFYTYDEIIRQNRWDIESLNTWNSIKVSLEEGKVSVEFPTISSDNINFFTNAILPKHTVESMDVDTYMNYFALAPITDGCASIMSQTKDVNSLIFDLNGCENTKFAYYQIKRYGSFEEFNASLEGINQKAIVDVYQSSSSLEGFTGQNVLTPKLLGVFFNTDSGKATIRLRRSIGGLIYHNFFTGDYNQYVDKYDGAFLNYYVSAGENVSELLNRLSVSEDENSIDTNDLKDSGAQELPNSMSINGVDRKFVFFMQKTGDSRNLEIKFSNEFSNIKVVASTDNSTWSPKNYNTKDKKITYKLTNGGNLKVGANNFTISGVIKNKTYTIASIDIYVFENLTTSANEDNQWKLSVLYYNDPVSNFAVQQMKDIFKSAGIIDNFVFESVYNAEELEGKLLMGTYDIYVGSIDLGTRKDVLALFGTEDPLLNPSRYRNPILTSLINQYRKTRDVNVQKEINILLAQDMPLVLLGNTYEAIQLQNKIKEDIFTSQDSENPQKVYAYKWRYDIYSKYSIVHSVRANVKNAFKFSNFADFIKSSLYAKDKSVVSLDTSKTEGTKFVFNELNNLEFLN